ncbi:glycosyltransferase family 4 protein [Flavobacterium johnsoniae]|uniref:Glycosyltransferase involved in cell wall bisynthesis n=1 Tax=Flavobacterium johnsoniae TaxID=986 RepID=A0A1M5P838_FLAJO|nr:glycosyltransferase family 1 protein [Flavobacterium johnsoniae]SHG97589.1 Glycosyltransferase involved in cell wall bisynthesis [Flavobacterium johnsoniae]
MMKIILDSQAFNYQKYGGVSRYYTEIFSILSKKDNLEIITPWFYTRNIYYKESVLYNKTQKQNTFFLELLSKLGISIRKKSKKLNYSRTINRLNSKDAFDVFVPTYYDPYFLDLINGKPFVLTVYDMIHELFPEYFSDADELKKNKLLLIEKAAKIIAVSQNTKKDILTLYPHIDESKIEVIYHGTSIKVNENAEADLPENYILYVGSRSDYKNFKFLADSIKVLLKNNPNLFLVCAGGGKFDKEEIEFIKSLDLEKQILQLDFKEHELGYFYKKAKCFVFPSLYEGFGIPVLESMACECPVVLGNHSSFSEVAGNAGVYFDVNSKDDLRNKIQSLLENEALRIEFSLKGIEQIKRFTWENAAQQCLDLYKKSVQIN